MIRNQKGITLVALVITIIVLLILAGVSISMLTGNNGVLTKASSASSSTEIATVKENVQTAIAAAYTDALTTSTSATSVSLDAIKTYIDDQQGTGTYGADGTSTNSFYYNVNSTTKYKVVLTDGNRKIATKTIDGTTTDDITLSN